MKGRLIWTVFAGALFLTACSSGDSEEPSADTQSPEREATEPSAGDYELYGSVGLTPAFAITDGDETCIALEPYMWFDDDGLQAVVKDASSSVVAIADVGPVRPFNDGCVRDITGTVPAGGEFYTVEVEGEESDVTPESDIPDNDTLAFLILLD